MEINYRERSINTRVIVDYQPVKHTMYSMKAKESIKLKVYGFIRIRKL